MLPISKSVCADLGLLQDRFDTVVSCKNPIICSFFYVLIFSFSCYPASGQRFRFWRFYVKLPERSSGSAPFPTCTQGGKGQVVSNKTWVEYSLPISFTHVAVSHQVSCMQTDTVGGYACAISGAAAGHSDKDYFRLSSTANVWLCWLIIGY